MLLADTLFRAYVPGTSGQGELEFEIINMIKYLPIYKIFLPIQRENENYESLQVHKTVIQQGRPEQETTLPSISPSILNFVGSYVQKHCKDLFWSVK